MPSRVKPRPWSSRAKAQPRGKLMSLSASVIFSVLTPPDEAEGPTAVALRQGEDPLVATGEPPPLLAATGHRPHAS
eukprot:11159030-Lingulodinium_polyedra.AAC.1